MKALVLAGGMPQITLLDQLRERGISTVLIDGSNNPVARPYADKFYQADIFDISTVRRIAVDERVDFLITVCADQVLLVVAEVAEMLGLPWYIDYDTAKRVSDKELMKQVFLDYGIPTSRHVVLSTLDLSRIENLQYPLIVKPVDAYSSKGVRKVVDESELRVAFDNAITISREKKVIVEEFFEGEEISVDLFIENGKAQLLCISNSEKIKDTDHFVIFRGRFPVHTSSLQIERIEGICQKIADAFHIKNAPMLVQLLTDGERITVLEFCARTGGAMKWLLIKHSSGVDVIKAVIDLTLGVKPEIKVKEPENKYIVNDFIYCKAGIFDRLDGFEEQLKLGNITDYRCLRPQGMKFSGLIESSSDRVVGVTIQADTLEEFNLKHRSFVEGVKVLDIYGNDIMRHDLLPDLQDTPQ